MKSISKPFGVLLAAAVFTTTALKADDKPATITIPAPAAKATPDATVKAGTAMKMDSLFADAVIAKGKGVEVKRSQLDEMLAGLKSRFAAQGQKPSPADLPMMEKSCLDTLLQVQLFKSQATDADKAKAREVADKRLESIKKSSPSEEILATRLKSINMTVESLRARFVEESTAEEVLRGKVKVTDADVKKFYDDNPSKFEEPEMVRASHILISTGDPQASPGMPESEKKAKRKIADGLLARANKGEDFAKLAKEYSDDPGSKDKGGEYTFPRGQMAPEFEAAAFSLKTNQISDIVTTKFGYHIIKLNEKIPANKIELSKASPRVREYLEGVEIQKIVPEFYAKLKKEANVEILDPQLKALEAAGDQPAKLAPTGAVAPK